MLARLEIADFRNLAAVRLDCAPGLNLISGDNAAGKTSLLEAVYLLGRARSFRTQRPAELIRRGAAHWRLVARLGAGGSAGTLGLQRDGAQFTARLNGAPLPSLAELARVLPVLLLTPDSHRLLDDGPRPRRRFLDWGVFQRDAGFLAHWRRCQLALRQRNAALRQPAMLRSLPGWEAELVSAAGPLDAARAGFVEALAAAAQPQLQALLDTDLRLTLDDRRGWPAGRRSARCSPRRAKATGAPVIPATAHTAPISPCASTAARPAGRCRAARTSCWSPRWCLRRRRCTGRPAAGPACCWSTTCRPSSTGRTARVSSSVWPRPARRCSSPRSRRRPSAGRCRPMRACTGSRPARWWKWYNPAPVAGDLI
ncbi:DNA replication/repair protein RecF [Plasticicumulans sp.]|uniref:DNA replication/repair protein RecF n=3 Tax=Plasticicumulans sp. TaxID=2307179 RepID=UPI003956C8A3